MMNGTLFSRGFRYRIASPPFERRREPAQANTELGRNTFPFFPLHLVAVDVRKLLPMMTTTTNERTEKGRRNGREVRKIYFAEVSGLRRAGGRAVETSQRRKRGERNGNRELRSSPLFLTGGCCKSVTVVSIRSLRMREGCMYVGERERERASERERQIEGKGLVASEYFKLNLVIFDSHGALCFGIMVSRQKFNKFCYYT